MQKINSQPVLSPGALMLGCLTATGILHVLTMVFVCSMGPSLQSFMVMLLNGTAALFLGTVLTRPRPRTAEPLLMLGMGFFLWTVVLELLNLRDFSLFFHYEPRFPMNTFLCEYLMLLPMAAMLDENGRDRGLKVYFSCFFAGLAVYIVLGLMLATDTLPEKLSSIILWRGTRLGLMWHPNVLSGLLLVGFGVTLTLGWAVRWLRIPMVLLAAVEYYLMALTNTRTVTIMAACIAGGVVFFLIYGNHISWKRFLVGLLAAVLVIGLMFSISTMIYSSHVEHFTTDSQELEQALWQAGQGSLRSDFTDFNSRGGIWKGALRAIKDHPAILFRGTWDIGGLISPYNAFRVSHAHNAWLQTLMGTGLVGLGFCLVLTWLAVKNILLVWFVKESTMYQKIVGLMTTAIMGAQMMEVYIFYTQFPHSGVQAAYMLCVGYLVYWGKTLPDRKKTA